LARDEQSPNSEADVTDERNDQGARGLVAGRVEELRRLEASERGLAEAFVAFARTATGGGRMLHLAERHRSIAELLVERMAALGGEPDRYPDDLWIIGPTDEIETILYAEQTALRTYHDHLVDFDGDTLQLVRDRILPDHENTLELLTNWRDALAPGMELG
jgi:hypothetical protein